MWEREYIKELQPFLPLLVTLLTGSTSSYYYNVEPPKAAFTARGNYQLQKALY